MNEDKFRILRGEGVENLSVVRYIALNLLNVDKPFKAGLKRKQTKAGRNNESLLATALCNLALVDKVDSVG